MSKHEVKVVRITETIKHPNADRLDLVPLYDGGFTAIAGLGQFKPGDLAIFVEPDYVLPIGEARWQNIPGLKKARIRCKKIRGIPSQGLLVPADPGMKEGDDVMALLNITRYAPKVKKGGHAWLKGLVGQAAREISFSSWQAPPPAALTVLPAYDLESIRKRVKAFQHGEEVVATEKIHGSNARFVFDEDGMHAGSREQWKKESDSCLWWTVVHQNAWVSEFCKANPHHVLYGEVFGQVQQLKYGAGPKEIFFRVFDVRTPEGKYWQHEELEAAFTEAQRCPVIYRGPFDFKLLQELSVGDSKVPGANHLSEGLVIRPVKSDTRSVLKLVSDRYLEKAPEEETTSYVELESDPLTSEVEEALDSVDVRSLSPDKFQTLLRTLNELNEDDDLPPCLNCGRVVLAGRCCSSPTFPKGDL